MVTAEGTASLVARHLVSANVGLVKAEIWFARVSPHAGECSRISERYLSAEERGRYGAFRDPAAAARYVITRALVRQVLSDQLGVRPRELMISRTDTGKPVIASGVHFNVSHSGDLVLLAVSVDCDVGVDVERRRIIDRVDALVARWLSAGERAEMESRVRGGGDPSDAFLRVWSLKEARLKAIGVGIAGAGQSQYDAIAAIPLDALGTLSNERDVDGYVGALAFASSARMPDRRL